MANYYGKRRCHICGHMVTTNALGRASHERSCRVRTIKADQEREQSRREQLAGRCANEADHI